MTRWSALLGPMAWLISGAGGTPASPGQYVLNAETLVHAESGIGTYERTIRTTLDASLMISGAEASLDVHRDGYACVLRGAAKGDSLTLFLGQRCPQSIRGDGFQADLDGRLKSGSVTISANSLVLTTQWDVRGTVTVGPLSIPVTGTVSTTATGPKI